MTPQLIGAGEYAQRLTCDGVDEVDLPGVEKEPGTGAVLLLVTLAAIAGVTQEGVTDGGEVSPYLVGAPGAGPGLGEAVLGSVGEAAIAGAGLFLFLAPTSQRFVDDALGT